MSDWPELHRHYHPKRARQALGNFWDFMQRQRKMHEQNRWVKGDGRKEGNGSLGVPCWAAE